MAITRKQFLEMSTALAGTTLAAASMPWLTAFQNPAPTGNSASDRIRIGFVGLGGRGNYLLHTMMLLKDRLNVEVVAVCDDHPPHLDRAMEVSQGQAAGFLDFREMFDKVKMDGVIIATPPAHHAGPTFSAFEHGVHVFCEKVMSRDMADTKRMYDKHIEHNAILVTGYQRAYSPVYLTGIERIRSGEYGDITRVQGHWHRNRDWIEYPGIEPGSKLDRKLNWRLYRNSSGGMITELCSHHLHIANWVFDAAPVSVMGSGSIAYWKDQREVWDNFGLIFKYADGRHFLYNCLQNNKHNGVQIQALGNKGMVDLEVNREFWEEPPAPPAIRQLIHDIESSLFESIPIGGATWVPAEPVKYGGQYITENWQVSDTELYLEAFMDFIRKGSAPETLTIQGYNASIWALMAEKATYSGLTETLPEEYRL